MKGPYCPRCGEQSAIVHLRDGYFACRNCTKVWHVSWYNRSAILVEGPVPRLVAYVDYRSGSPVLALTDHWSRAARPDGEEGKLFLQELRRLFPDVEMKIISYQEWLELTGGLKDETNI